jgi:hexokinase
VCIQQRKVLRVTPHDNKCDRKSVNPRKQAFEKMVSGMYIGEVVRNVLLNLIDRGFLFNGHSSTTLNRHYGLDTALMSAIEALPAQAYSTTTPPKKSDWQASIAETRKVLTQNVNINNEHITDEDCLLVRRVSEIVGTRGARLAAVAVATTLIQRGYDQKDTSTGQLPEFSIGVDGSLVELYPHFEIRLRQALVEIVGQDVERKVRFGLAKDGSGVGGKLTFITRLLTFRCGHS